MSQGLCRGTVGWHVHGERSTAPVDSASVPLEHRLNVFLLSQLVPDRAVGDRRLDFFNEGTSRGVLRRLCSQRDQVRFAAGFRLRTIGTSHAAIVRRDTGQAVTGMPLAVNARNGACYLETPLVAKLASADFPSRDSGVRRSVGPQRRLPLGGGVGGRPRLSSMSGRPARTATHATHLANPRARFVRERIRIGRYSTVMAGRKSRDAPDSDRRCQHAVGSFAPYGGRR